MRIFTRHRIFGIILALALAAPARAVVSTTTSVVEYTCNGATKTFTVPFRFLDQTHLRVSRVLVADPYTETVLPIGSVYTVGGAGSATGGTVSLVTPSTGCTSAYKLRIRRLTPRTQGTALSTQGPYSPKALEAALDRQTMIAQELNDGSLIANRLFDFSIAPPDSVMVTATGAAVPLSLSDHLAAQFDARGFRVRCDDLTDNTNAIRDAIAAALPVGGVVQFPPGVCRFYGRLSVDTSSAQRQVTLRGAGNGYTTILDYYGSQSPAIAIGTQDSATVDNSGNVNLQTLRVRGTHSVGEVDGVYATNGSRFTSWSDVTVEGFAGGTGLQVYNTFLSDWRNIALLTDRQAMKTRGTNGLSIENLTVEQCGPAAGNGHISATDPSVDLGGQELTVTNLSIESNHAATTQLKLTGQVFVFGLYGEANAANTTGNEILLSGVGPSITGSWWNNGVSTVNPNPRYMISMGDSVGARIRDFNYFSPSPNPTNTLYGVDFATSDRADVEVTLWGYEQGITQRDAYAQSYRGNSKTFTFNGEKHVGGMPIAQLGSLLFSATKLDYNPLMLVPDSTTGVVSGFYTDNLNADATLVKGFPLVGATMRVQRINAAAAAEASIYYQWDAGALDPSHAFFVSSWIYANWATATNTLMKTVNGTSVQVSRPLTATGIGWRRVSSIHTFPHGGNTVRAYPAVKASGDSPSYTTGLVMIDLTQFDLDHGTSLASMSVLQVEDILDVKLLSPLYAKEFTRTGSVPTDGTYARGAIVWYALPSAAGKIGAVCVAVTGTACTTWKDFGAIDP